MALSKELDYLGRTFMPKVIIYNSDGGGRDTYIQTNNGGFFHGGVKSVIKGDQFDFYSKYNHLYDIRKQPVSIRYRSDGTGRDSYVMVNSGGFESPSRSLKSIHITDFLRNSPKSKFIPRHGKHNSMHQAEFLTSKQKFMKTEHMKHEKEIVNRLYSLEKTNKFRKANLKPLDDRVNE